MDKLEKYLYLRKINKHEKLRKEIQAEISTNMPEYWLNYWYDILTKLDGKYKKYNNKELIIQSIKGFYFDEQPTQMTLKEFAGSKRPLGNKNIPASIIYRLGIDINDVLEISDILPRFIENWCNNLLDEIIKEL